MKRNHIAVALIVLFIFALTLYLNYIQPLRGDDFGRACTDVLGKGLIMMVHSIEADYFTWTGRVSAQALIYLLLSKTYIGLSLFIINTVSSIAFVIFMFISFKIVSFDKAKIVSKDFLIFSLFFTLIFYQTGFIGNILWKTAAIQYFWGITLLTTLYYLTIIKGKENIIFAIFVGSVIGLYNEIYVAISTLLCLCYFVDRKIYKQPINNAIVAFFISCLIGGVILIGAPGNYARLDSMSHGIHTNSFDNIINLLNQIISRPTDTAILIVMLIVFIALIFSNKNIKKVKATLYTLTLVCSIFILTPVVKSYDINQRVLLIYYAVFFIATYQQFYTHNSKTIIKARHLLNKLSLLIAIVLALYLLSIVNTRIELYKFEKYRNQLVSSYQKKGIKNPKLPCLTYMSATIFNDDITADKNSYNNKAYAEFYGFNSVECDHIYNNVSKPEIYRNE
ncbi:DUF6056 family protein [Francisella sp. SYW-9]|uniref:DUF6056 family protein n=1 Tax=Francisella sp. SYW-9 TaxID=2610888 RepID=UPI00123DE06D|nr:DUF6056 family protein [Francisella sp. SYW-9]